jgi:hypothetical protein
MILVPAVITLAVTILRLEGELQHWLKLFFNPAAGGGAALFGIAWLPFIFRPYFAVKLAGSGQGPTSGGKAIGFAVAALLLTFLGGFVAFQGPPGSSKIWPATLIIVMASAAVFLGWPALAKSLLAYGYAARVPVALVMFFAIQNHWGTHYDVLPPNYVGPTDFWGLYLHIALVPQLVFWINYTMVIGALLGTIFGAVVGRKKAAPQTA